ncbi:MAG TPA: hypothetical protein PLJ21_00280 [Pseudobdellovibrionaceae bacterium]|nr:hypothetical protein [Pseudobdellovibrionaceae bacterium]
MNNLSFSSQSTSIISKSFIVLLLSAGIAISCQQKSSTDQPQDATGATTANLSISSANAANWAAQMHRLSEAIAQLIPFTSSTKEFNNPENYEAINRSVKELSELSHKVSDKDMKPDNDPSLEFISNQFAEELQRASESLKMGHRDYARHLLRNSTSYCIQCHTRNESGPNFSSGRIDSVVQALSPLEKGEYYAATRQFDKSFESLKSVLMSPPDQKTNVLTWDRAARYALAIAVRFQNNVDHALEISDLIIKSSQAPTFLKDDAKHWKKSLLEWKKESKKTDTTTFEFAKSLIANAQKIQKYTTDHGADVYYLRATSTLHKLLAQNISGPKKSELLYQMGLSYDALRDLNFWTLHEQYYESCIRNTPHTSIAVECFKKYEESIFFGFSGSAGYSLPADIQLKLSELRGLAIKK